jgi:hypothetical protein
MPLPQIKLALIFAKMAKDHGHKLLHANNPDLLTRDLGDAMRKQKDILSDPNKSSLFTAYDVLPVILEVKILSAAVAKKLDIDTKGKADITILEEIVEKSNERNGGKYATDIKGTLDWTRELFSNPEIQDVLKMEVTQIDRPKNIKDITKFFGQLAGRSQDELTRVSEFLRRAKEKKPEPKTEPKAEDKKDPPAPPAP